MHTGTTPRVEARATGSPSGTPVADSVNELAEDLVRQPNRPRLSGERKADIQRGIRELQRVVAHVVEEIERDVVAIREVLALRESRLVPIGRPSLQIVGSERNDA